MPDDSESRQRWTRNYAVVLSTALAALVVLVTSGVNMKGYRPGPVLQVVLVIAGIGVAVMAAESLAWRLKNEQRRTLMLATLAIGALLVVATVVKLIMIVDVCTLPYVRTWERCMSSWGG